MASVTGGDALVPLFDGAPAIVAGGDRLSAASRWA
jgi:hypothetical protein